MVNINLKHVIKLLNRCKPDINGSSLTYINGFPVWAPSLKKFLATLMNNSVNAVITCYIPRFILMLCHFLFRAASFREDDTNDIHEEHGCQAAQETSSEGQEEEQQ